MSAHAADRESADVPMSERFGKTRGWTATLEAEESR
jgi:hypothetical protein